MGNYCTSSNICTTTDQTTNLAIIIYNLQLKQYFVTLFHGKYGCLLMEHFHMTTSQHYTHKKTWGNLTFSIAISAHSSSCRCCAP